MGQSEAESIEEETGVVCLFPIVVGDMIFNESVTLEHTWRETPTGFHPSLRQIAEWSAELRERRDEVDGVLAARQSW